MRLGQQTVSQSKPRIARDRCFKQFDGLGAIILEKGFPSAKIEIVGGHVPRGLALDRSFFIGRKSGLELRSDFLRKLAFQEKQISLVLIVTLRPNLRVSAGIYQPGVESNPVTGLLRASFQHVRDTQRPANFSRVFSHATITGNTGTTDYFKIGNLAEIGNNVVLNAIQKVTVVALGIETDKGKHGNTLLRRGYHIA